MKKAIYYTYTVLLPLLATYLLGYSIYIGKFNQDTATTILIVSMVSVCYVIALVFYHFMKEERKQEALGYQFISKASPHYVGTLNQVIRDFEFIYKDTYFDRRLNLYAYECSGGIYLGEELHILLCVAEDDGF